MTIQYQNIVGIPGAINGIDPGLFPFYIDKEIVFRQYLPKIPLTLMMGDEPSNPIVMRKVNGGQGFQVRTPQMQSINYTNPVRDYNQVRGQAQQINTKYDYYNIGKVSFPCDLTGEQLTDFGTPIRIQNYVSSEITDACALALNKEIIDAATFIAYSNTATMKPSYDRIVLAGVSPSRTTYNAYAGINAALATMTAGVAYDQCGLSTTVLLNAKDMADQGGNTNGVVWSNGVTIENKIPPSKVISTAGWPENKYVGFFSPAALRALYKDELYQAVSTTRGTVISPKQPEMLSGADYVGEFEGINLHRVSDLNQYTITTGGRTYAWGLLIGASAWEVSWGVHPYIVSDNDRIEDYMIWTSHEIRGQKALAFPPKQASTVNPNTGVAVPVEQGIIHIFTQIA